MTTDASFEAISPPLKAALRRRGFSTLTPVQQAVVQNDVEGRDLRISSQTGSGKTVALGLALAPALEGPPDSAPGPRALVLVPTRELAAQVRTELGTLYADVPNLRVIAVTGGTEVYKEREQLRAKPRLLIATPGRLLDHIRNGAVDLSSVQHAVLDEADQMLDMGFRDELDEVLSHLPEGRSVHLVSATFAERVLRFADKFQHNVLWLEGTQLGVANSDIEHVAHLVLDRERHGALVNLLLAGAGDRWLVFVRRRADTAELAERLVEDGFSAMPFSGDLSQVQRERTLNAFRRGLVKVLVATDVAARGIDIADVSTVVHYDLPIDVETYTHRSGRTGRAGRKGRCLILVPPAAEGRVRRLLKSAQVDAGWLALPTAAKIQKSVVKQTRRDLRNRLDGEIELSEGQKEYVTNLLESYEAPLVIGVLLEMAERELPRLPAELRVLEPRGEMDYDRPRRSSGRYMRRGRFNGGQGRRSNNGGGSRRPRRERS